MASLAARLVVDALCSTACLSPLYWHADALTDAASLAAAVDDPRVLRHAEERLSSQPEFTGTLGGDITVSDVVKLYGEAPPADTPSRGGGRSRGRGGASQRILSGGAVRRLLRRKFHTPERWYDFMMGVCDDDPPAVRQLARAYAASLPKLNTSQLIAQLGQWPLEAVRTAVVEPLSGGLSERAVAKAVAVLHEESDCDAVLTATLWFMSADNPQQQVEVMTRLLDEDCDFTVCWEDFTAADPGLEARTTPLEDAVWDRCRAATHLVCAPGAEHAVAAWLLGLRPLSELTADAEAMLPARIARYVERGWLRQGDADEALGRLGDAEVCEEVARVLRTLDEFAACGMEVELDDYEWEDWYDGDEDEEDMPFMLRVAQCVLGEYRLTDIPDAWHWWDGADFRGEGEGGDDGDPFDQPVGELTPREVRGAHRVLQRFQTLATAMKAAKLRVREDSQLCRAFVVEGQGEVSSVVDTMREMRFFFEETDYGSFVRVLSKWGSKPGQGYGSLTRVEASWTAKLAALHMYKGKAPVPARFVGITQDAKRVAYEEARHAQQLEEEDEAYVEEEFTCEVCGGSAFHGECEGGCYSSDDDRYSMRRWW